MLVVALQKIGYYPAQLLGDDLDECLQRAFMATCLQACKSSRLDDTSCHQRQMQCLRNGERICEMGETT